MRRLTSRQPCGRGDRPSGRTPRLPPLDPYSAWVVFVVITATFGLTASVVVVVTAVLLTTWAPASGPRGSASIRRGWLRRSGRPPRMCG